MGINALMKKGTTYKDPNFPENNGTVYVHLMRESFYKRIGDTSTFPADVNAARQETYKRQRERFRTRIKNNSGFSYDEYAKVTKVAEEVLETMLVGEGQNNLAIQLQEAIKKRGVAGLSSKWSFNKQKQTYSSELKDLVKDVEKMQKVFDSMKAIYQDYIDIDTTIVKAINAEREKKGKKKITSSDNDLYMITDTGQAKTSFAGFAKNIKRLESLLASSKGQGFNPSTQVGKEVMEIYRKFSGQLNNIQGIGYEAIIDYLLSQDNIQEMILERLESTLGVPKGSIEIVKEASLGKGYTVPTKTMETRRATTDVAFTIKINRGEMTGSFDMNLSAKSIPKVTGNGLKKRTVTYKKSRPWETVAKDLNLLNTEFEYWFANMSTKGYSAPKKKGEEMSKGRFATGNYKDVKETYAAMKDYISFAYALDAIGGTGGDIQGASGQNRDTVTHMIYLNKVMTVLEVLDELEKSKNGGLNMKMSGPIDQSAYYKEDVYDKYVRSKSVLAAVRGITMTFTK